MRKKINFLFFTIILFTSCKTVSVQNKQYQTTTQKVTLGSVGIDETFELERTYSHVGNPNYTEPVRVQITPIPFNKTTYKAFEKARNYQPVSVSVRYVDSVEIKPMFVNIETFDKIGLINILNDTTNKDIKGYLENQNQSHLVTNISMALNETEVDELSKAEEIFIQNNGVKSVALKLYKGGKLTRTLNFNEGIIFAYRTSSACWKENSKYKLEIVDLIEGDSGCPNQTYSSAKRAKKEVDYFKFKK